MAYLYSSTAFLRPILMENEVKLYLHSIALLDFSINLNLRNNIGSYMSAYVLLNLLNELEKSNKMSGLLSI